MDPNTSNLDLNSYLDKIVLQTWASNKFNSEISFNYSRDKIVPQDMDVYIYFEFKYSFFIKKIKWRTFLYCLLICFNTTIVAFCYNVTLQWVVLIF